MLLRGPSEKILINRFIERKSKKTRLQCLTGAMPKSVMQVFLKENVRYPVWTCTDPIFSYSRDPMIIFPDSRDPIFTSGVPKTP